MEHYKVRYKNNHWRKTYLTKEECLICLDLFLIQNKSYKEIFKLFQNRFTDYQKFANIMIVLQDDPLLMSSVLIKNEKIKEPKIPKGYKKEKQFSWKNDLGMSREEYIDYIGAFEIVYKSKMNTIN